MITALQVYQPSATKVTARWRPPGVIIAMIPIGGLLGFLGDHVIEIIVRLIASAAFTADHPATFS